MKKIKHFVWTMVFCVAGVCLSAAEQDRPRAPKNQVLPAPKIVRSRVIASLQMTQTQNIFQETFESGASNWSMDGSWAVGTPTTGPGQGHASSQCAGTNLGGSYPNHADDALVTPTINLPSVTGPDSYIRLTFWEWFETESGYDYGKVYILTDNGTDRTLLDSRDGWSDWRETMIELTSYAGESVQIEFRFTSDGSATQEGWFIDDVRLVLEQPEPLEATMVSLNHQKFPFIYMNIAVDTFRVGFPDLVQNNFIVYENGVLQADYFEVTPPESGGGSRRTDVIFLMDNSGSMEEEINAVRNNVNDFVDNLAASGIDFALGLCRFGADENNGRPIIEDNGILTSDKNYFKSSVWNRNVTDGGYEPGWDALYQATTSFSFRPGSQKIFILITDENVRGDGNSGSYTQAESIQILQANSITTFALIELDYTSIGDYGTIAEATNGAYFDIYSNFDDILDYISSQVANTYLVRYKSSDPVENGVERHVEILVNYNGNEAMAEGYYTPGSAPRITRTQNTLAYHERAWADGTQFSIEVEIIDNVTPYVQGATLYFKNTSSSSYRQVPMSNTSGDVWQANIYSAYVQSPGVDYYITATDGGNTASDPSVDPINNPYQIAILPNEAPEITHTPVTSLTPNTAITITAAIIDNTNTLMGGRLYYKKTGQLIYEEVQMTPISSDNYTAEIPADFVTNDGVDYYIRAWDDFGVNGYSGTPDAPHVIEAEKELSIFLNQKINIANSILDIERPAKSKNDPFFDEIENEAKIFANQIKTEWQTNPSESVDLEAVARLAVSENVTLRAINDVIPISSYGAKGLRSIATSLLLKGIFTKLAKICQKVPLIGNYIHKSLMKVSDKFHQGTQKLFHIYLTGHTPVPGVPYQTTIAEFIVSQNAAQAAIETVDEKLTEMAVEAVTEETIGTSIFEIADHYIQDYLFLDVFEHVSEAKQHEAVEIAKSGGYSQEFVKCQQDVTRTYSDMVRWNNFVNDSEHFLDILNELVGWAAFAAGIVLIIVGILGAVATGGVSLLASIAGIATSILTYSTLISTTLAITQASTVGVYVDAVVPFTFLNPSVDQAFGQTEAQLLAKKSANSISQFTQLDSLQIDNKIQKEIEYIEKIRQRAVDDNFSFLKQISEFNSLSDETSQYENQVLALFSSVIDTALSIDPEYYNRINALGTTMASRIFASSAMDIYSLVYNNGYQADDLKDEIQSFLYSYSSNLSTEESLIQEIDDFIRENNLPLPPVIGVNTIKCYKDQYANKIFIEPEICNYSDVGPLTDIDVIIKSNTTLRSDSVLTISLNSKEKRTLAFEIEAHDLISGIVYTTDHSSTNKYKHMGGLLFSFDIELVSPTTGKSLDNNNIYFYPNPFNPDTETGIIRYSLAQPGNVTIKIYDAANKLVKTVIEEAPRDAGVELAEPWDGKNEEWDIVANGVYFYVIESSGGEQAVGKIAVLR
ncbi:VWA domain-containing protein [candidate division KSB1 bacterium]|nr:VWA domain-containing protein [candidate division KSB1 bacterium]